MSLQINIDEIISGMKSTIEEMYKDNYEQIKELTENYLEASKLRLQSLANDYLKGELTSEFFLDRIKDEQAILTSQLLSYKVMGLSMAKDISETALLLLVGAVNKLLE